MICNNGRCNIYPIFVSHLFASGRCGVSLYVCGSSLNTRWQTWAPLKLSSAVRTDKQSDPHSDSLAEKIVAVSLDQILVPTSLSLSKVPYKDGHAHMLTLRSVLCYLMSGGVWGGKLWDANMVLEVGFVASLSQLSSLNLLNMKQKPKNKQPLSWLQVYIYTCSSVCEFIDE